MFKISKGKSKMLEAGFEYEPIIIKTKKLNITIAAIMKKYFLKSLNFINYLTSNLYPTPQTVLSDHSSEMFSNFSRSLFI